MNTTQYQIIAQNVVDNREFHVGFSRIPSADGILRTIRRRVDFWLQQTGLPRNATYHKFASTPKGCGIVAGNWHVSYSGKTLRDLEFTS